MMGITVRNRGSGAVKIDRSLRNDGGEFENVGTVENCAIINFLPSPIQQEHQEPLRNKKHWVKDTVSKTV
jgi:hypothetical protein